MRIAIFSDIHGNDIAFEAAIHDAKERNADEFIVAGDLVSDYPLASQVIARAKALTPHVIKGNREAYFEKFFSASDMHWKEYKQFAGMLWSFGHMSDDDFQYIRSLPEQLEISFEEGLSFRVIHYVRDVESFLMQMPQRILVCGHSHKPAEMISGNKMFLNPGSVGVNMSNGFNAEYMLLDYINGEITTQIIHVPYDKNALRALFDDPVPIGDEDAVRWFKLLFATQESGINYMSELFAASEKMKAELGYTCFDTPNEIWDKIMLMFMQRGIL